MLFRSDYLALGDWHGCKQINARTWYSGTPEPDRFRDNGAGQALVVDIPAPGALPDVKAVVTARHPWLAHSQALQVASDLDVLIDAARQWPEHGVVSLSLSGHLDLAGQQRLDAALGEASARLRHLGVDRSALQLQPTDDDIAQLHADGYLAELITELRDAQAPGAALPTGVSDPAVPREALSILAALLSDMKGAAA